MQHRLILPLLCCFAGFAQTAHAAPPVIDKSQAVAGPRATAGTGICGSATHFMAAQPLVTQAEAVALLNKSTTDPAILGRTARLFDNINFRNSQLNTSGDFTLPNYRDEFFPFSADMTASPMGTDFNIAIRLRGYFNVPATLIGKTISFGVNCDDFCSLQIGKTVVVPLADERYSSRVIKQVMFKDAGLYPLEMIYYQNGSTAYLEWVRTDTAVPECPNDVCQIPLTDTTTYAGQFKLVQRAELYSAIVGENPRSFGLNMEPLSRYAQASLVSPPPSPSRRSTLDRSRPVRVMPPPSRRRRSPRSSSPRSCSRCSPAETSQGDWLSPLPLSLRLPQRRRALHPVIGTTRSTCIRSEWSRSDHGRWVDHDRPKRSKDGFLT